jgi:hypothetical protein
MHRAAGHRSLYLGRSFADDCGATSLPHMEKQRRWTTSPVATAAGQPLSFAGSCSASGLVFQFGRCLSASLSGSRTEPRRSEDRTSHRARPNSFSGSRNTPLRVQWGRSDTGVRSNLYAARFNVFAGVEGANGSPPVVEDTESHGCAIGVNDTTLRPNVRVGSDCRPRS